MTDYKKWESIEASIPDDEEDKARRRLREQRDNMTGDEVRRLHECWEKPEFKAMFHEYAEEVSDPAHRAESEKYLAQCEAEQRAERNAKQGYLNGRAPGEFDSLSNSVPGQPEAPEGAQLLKPNQGFVVKTWKKNPGKSDFDRELGKLFINVCSHEDIDRPAAQEVTAPDGRRGQSWTMPHLCSPALKEEKDKAGHKCFAVDIVFHPEVLKRIEAPHGMGERWKGMVTKTALDMVAKLHQLELDVDGHKVLNMKYFGDTGEGPSTLSWKPAGAFEEKAAPEPARAAPAGNKATTTPKPVLTPTPAPAPVKAESAPPKVATAAPAQKPAPSKAPAKPKTRAPKYSIVHRGVGDLGSTWNDSKVSTSSRPRELCVKLELPELSSAGEIDLDITERKLEMSHEGEGYLLSLPLPYPVLADQGSAKFDKAKRVLTVTLPVAAATAPMPVWQPTDKGQTDEERAAEEAAEKAAEAEARALAEAEESTRRDAERAARDAKAKQEEEERAARRQAAIAQAEREAARRAEKLAQKQAAGKSPSVPSSRVKADASVESASAALAPPKAKAPSEACETNAPKQEDAPAKTEDKENESDWVEVSEAEAAAAKAASPSKVRPPLPPMPTPAPVKAADPPAAAAGGLPKISNQLLFELD